MKNVKNGIIFPMNSDAQTLILNKDLALMNLSHVVSFPEDKIAIAGRLDIEAMDEALHRSREIDYAIICDDINDVKIKKIYDASLLFRNKGISVVYDGNLSRKLRNKGLKISDANCFSGVKEYQKYFEQKKLFTIDKPIISVMGTSSSVQKFDMQISLKRVFQNRGYKVLSFCSNTTGKLLDMEILPDFLFDRRLSLDEKIMLLNQYVYDKVKTEECDVVIIGAPGGILPYNNKITERFGEIPFVISNALQIDYAILNIGYIYKSIDDYISVMKELCKYRFNTSIFACCISNNLIRENDIGDDYEIYSLSDSEAEKIALKYLDKEMDASFYWCNKIKREKVLNDLVDALENNIDCVS